MIESCQNCKNFSAESDGIHGWCDENEMRTIIVGQCWRWLPEDAPEQSSIRGWAARDFSTKLWFFRSEPQWEAEKRYWAGDGFQIPAELLPNLFCSHGPVQVELIIKRQ